MYNQVLTNENFSLNISQAVKSLRDNEYEKAYGFIVEAMRIDPDAPHPHNLLGIMYELKGDGSRARRHYRAAYSLDPTFEPACRNLEQICTLLDNYKLRAYDFGDGAVKSGRKAGAADNRIEKHLS